MWERTIIPVSERRTGKREVVYGIVAMYKSRKTC